MKFLAVMMVFWSLSASASRIVDLASAEVESANFLAQCAQELAGKNFSVVRGSRGTFREGVLYHFHLKSPQGGVSNLEVRWTKATQAFDCNLQEVVQE